jgi:3-hydroxyisobutyrate dehydrogenase-like beta-hydroxyacid dehydrogenase
MTTIGVLHPGEMGAAVGAVLAGAGHEVLWAGDGRSQASARRAAQAGLTDAGDVAGVLARAEIVFSIVPPHAAREVAAAGRD